MNKEKLVNVHLDSHFNISPYLCPSSVAEKDYMSHVPYANAVGFLMYAMVCTSSYISHAVGVVSKYMENMEKEN